MAAYPDDFDDVPEDESAAPLLPQDDRLWRHPSELGSANPAFAVDAVAVRRRWLQNQPSRASAWTAGLVGALLATGLVALGTHLATTITSSPSKDVDANDASLAAPLPTLAAKPLIPAMSSELAASVRRIGSSMVVINVANGASSTTCLGLVVGSNGMLVGPALALEHATSVLVTMPNNGPIDVGHVLGIDPSSGLAVLQVEGQDQMKTAELSADSSLSTSTYTVAVTAPTGSAVQIGDISALDVQPSTGGGVLVDGIETDIPVNDAPLGSVLMDARGNIAGIVTSSDARGAVATPAWIAAPVIEELMTTGAVTHGWLGITAVSTAAGARPMGAEVTAVTPKSAAAAAGVRKGDVIVALNGKPIHSFTALRARLYVLKAGTAVRLGVRRDGAAMTVHLVLDNSNG